MLAKVKEKILLYWPSLISAIVIFVYMYNIDFFGDDNGFANVGGNLSDIYEFLVWRYNVWSQRVIIEGILVIVSQHKLVWAIFSGVVLLVLLLSISKIVSKGNRHCIEIQIMVSMLVSLYPWRELSNAGWVATMNNYFCPLAFGFLSLVPVKKLLLDEKISKLEYIIYACALIYGCNQELEMVFLGVVYFLYTVYFVVRGYYTKNMEYKKLCYLAFQLLLILASAVFILVSPGVAARKATESARMLNFGEFSIIDKLDIGYSTTMHELIFGSKLYIIFSCLLLTYLVWKKYNDRFYRIIALIPSVVTIMFGPLNSVLYTLFPYLSFVSNDISEEGLVTEANAAFDAPITQYLVMCTVVLTFFLSVILILDNIQDILWGSLFLLGGILSRVAMGFSPTIYESGPRTFSIFGFAIIAVIALILTRGVEDEKLISRKEYNTLSLIMAFLCVFSLINVGHLIFIS